MVNNMNRNTFLKAVDMIDDSLIAKSMRPQRKQKSDVLFYLIGFAALVLVILATSLMFSKDKNDRSKPETNVAMSIETTESYETYESDETDEATVETTMSKEMILENMNGHENDIASVEAAIWAVLEGPKLNRPCISFGDAIPDDTRTINIICIAKNDEVISVWKLTHMGWVKGERLTELIMSGENLADNDEIICDFINGQSDDPVSELPEIAEKYFIYYSREHEMVYDYRIIKEEDRYRFVGTNKCKYCNRNDCIIDVYIKCDEALIDQFMNGDADLILPDEWTADSEDYLKKQTSELFYDFWNSQYFQLDVFCNTDPFKYRYNRDYAVSGIFRELVKRNDLLDVLEKEAKRINDALCPPEDVLKLNSFLAQDTVSSLYSVKVDFETAYPQIYSFLKSARSLISQYYNTYKSVFPEYTGVFRYTSPMPFIPTVDVIAYNDIDSSNNTILSKDKVYYGNYRFGNYVRIYDRDDESEIFIHIEFDNDTHTEMVETPDGMKPFSECFIFPGIDEYKAPDDHNAEAVVARIDLNYDRFKDLGQSDPLTVRSYASKDALKEALETEYEWLDQSEKDMLCTELNKKYSGGPVRLYIQSTNEYLMYNDIIYDEINDRLIIFPIIYSEPYRELTTFTNSLWIGCCENYIEGISYEQPDVIYYEY